MFSDSLDLALIFFFSHLFAAAEGEEDGDIIVTKTVKKTSSVVSGSSTEGRRFAKKIRHLKYLSMSVRTEWQGGANAPLDFGNVLLYVFIILIFNNKWL